MKTHRIAVIGAGMCGASVAHLLRQHSVAVSVFEKSRGSGGRMATRRLAHNQSLDLGTPFFIAQDRQFLEQVRVWEQQGFIAKWEANLFHSQNGQLRPMTDQPHRWVGTPRMSSLTRALLNGTHTHYRTHITTAHRDNNQWWLHDEHQQQFGPFTHLVITAPANQAMALLHDSPALSTQVEKAKLSAVWVVGLLFDQPLATRIDGGLVDHGPLQWCVRDSSKSQRSKAGDNWVIHASTEWSQSYLEQSPQWIIKTLTEHFADLIQCPIPPAHTALAHRWRYAHSNPLANGNALADTTMGLYVCGDWSTGGNVEGAWLSAQRTVSQLLSQLGLQSSNIASRNHA